MLHDHPRARTRKTVTTANSCHRYCGDGLQRRGLEIFIAVMLARERRWHADTAADRCTEFAAALAALPSWPLELVADAVVALQCADA
jgi:hypothetical protein